MVSTASVCDKWQNVYDDEAQEGWTLSQSISEIDEARSDSSIASDDSFLPSSWWARMLYRASEILKTRVSPGTLRTLKIASVNSVFGFEALAMSVSCQQLPLVILLYNAGRSHMC